MLELYLKRLLPLFSRLLHLSILVDCMRGGDGGGGVVVCDRDCSGGGGSGDSGGDILGQNYLHILLVTKATIVPSQYPAMKQLLRNLCSFLFLARQTNHFV